MAQIVGANGSTVIVTSSPGANVDLRLDNVELTHNPGDTGRGLSLVNAADDKVTINDSWIDNNTVAAAGTAGGFGGALFNQGGELTLNRSDVSYNTAAAGTATGGGGAGAIGTNLGTTTILDSTITNNTAEAAATAVL